MESERRPSVVLLSGGLDSAANLALCAKRDQPVLALTIRYGQRAADREVTAAKALCQFFGIKHQILDLSWLGALGGSALTDRDSRVPELESASLDDLSVIRDSARAVWVPNRNGVLIETAAAFAERMGAMRVVVGFNREEATTFPDNSSDFLAEISRSLRFSTANGVEGFSYTVHLDKREIVDLLRAECPEFPFELVWSCYHGGERPCGKCESCGRYNRARGIV